MCSCNKSGSGKTYVVTFANGGTKQVRSLIAAKLEVGRNPGATYVPVSS